jgi:hypothetical protein
MALSNDQKDRISEVIKDILLRRIENFPEIGRQIRNAPFHDAILECFKDKIGNLNVEMPYLIAIASWLHGLNTSLGSGFESISHILSGGYKRKFSGQFSLQVKESQSSEIESIIRDLKSGSEIPNLERENSLIFNYDKNDDVANSLPFSVDSYFERDNDIIAIELKSVRPNSGEGRGEKQKILYAKAALKLQNPEKNIKFFVGFPFDPTSPIATKYDKQRFFNYLIEFKKFFSPDEVLIAGELWDFLSGEEDTMDEILNVITETVLSVKIVL